MGLRGSRSSSTYSNRPMLGVKYFSHPSMEEVFMPCRRIEPFHNIGQTERARENRRELGVRGGFTRRGANNGLHSSRSQYAGPITHREHT